MTTTNLCDLKIFDTRKILVCCLFCCLRDNKQHRELELSRRFDSLGLRKLETLSLSLRNTVTWEHLDLSFIEFMQRCLMLFIDDGEWQKRWWCICRFRSAITSIVVMFMSEFFQCFLPCYIIIIAATIFVFLHIFFALFSLLLFHQS